MKYSIIIPTFERTISLNECIFYNFHNTGMSRESYEVIWIDDGSSKNLAAIETTMSTISPDFSVKKRRNEGTIKTKNLGLHISSGEYIIIMDSDFKMTENWLAEIDTILGKARLEVILLSDHFRDKWIGDEIEIEGIKLFKLKSNVVSGAFLISRDVLETVGYLDEAFGFYGLNDADWTYRLRRAGYEPYYLDKVSAEHLGVRGEEGDNREKKEESMKNNGPLLRKRIKSELVYYNPTLNNEQNNLIDLSIRETIT